MNTDKLQEIENSYINGQKRQMVNQIKAYGIKAFMVDYFDFVRDCGYSDHKAHYAVLVYTFFLLNN